MNEERWQKLSLIEQLANIGSDIFRAFSGKQDGENRDFWRALELIDLTMRDKRWKSKLPELGRLREAVCDAFSGKNEYNITPDLLKNYFLPFARLARRE